MTRTLKCLLGFSLLVAIETAGSCSCDHRRPTSAESEAAAPKTSSGLYKENAELVEAIRAEDTPSFLDKFPDTGTWRILSTHAVVPADLRMTRADLARELEAKGQMHSFLFGPRPWALRAFTLPPYDKAWQPLNAVQFGPPDVRRGDVSIAWRQEGTKWVVDAIAWPIQ